MDAGVPEATLTDSAALASAALLTAERCLLLYAGDDGERQLIRHAVQEALTLGEDMLMRFQEKHASGLTAVVYLRLLDSGLYHPLLCVTDDAGNELLRTDLPPCLELHALGEIRLSRKAVTIQPRRNAFASELEPMRFVLAQQAAHSDIIA